MDNNTELCVDEKKLFASPFLEEFNEETFLMDNPEASDDEIRRARLRHIKGNAIAISAARKVCGSCPMISLGCKKAIRDTPARSVYGVLGGATQEVRLKMQSAGKKNITVGDIFANPEGDMASQAGYALVREYTRLAEVTN